MRKIFLFLALALFLSGCVTLSKTMESWVGHHMSELVSSWGPPTREMSDGAGGRILIYEEERTFTSPGYSTTTYSSAIIYPTPTYPTQAKTVYHPPTTSGYTATRCFWVDKNGIIYKWSWKGL